MTWFHGTDEAIADRCLADGGFPDDYTSRQSVWGPGVYMSDDPAEVSRWGTRTLRLDVSQARLWDVSAERWGWGPSTVADNLPDEALRQRFREQTSFDSPRFRFGGEVYGEVLREVVEAMGYDGIVFRGDNDNRWAVCYKPELVLARPHLGRLDRPAPLSPTPHDAHRPFTPEL